MTATSRPLSASFGRKVAPAWRPCPSCGERDPSVFYEQRGVPVHSVLLMPTREAATEYRRGDIALGFCRACGFIANLAMEPELQEYSGRYEETQGFSSTFNAFARRLAEHLVDRYGLRGRTVLEIGCGKGEFLALLCELGGNRGIGFDPAYVGERNPARAGLDVTFISDFYSDRTARHQADFVCCKMTLEHIHETGDFVRMVRRTIGDRPETVVFFQVPNATRILREVAFWDIYYEHCSYFSAGSLARLFRRSGFEILDLRTDYDDQYLMLEARPASGRPAPALPSEEGPETLARDVDHFAWSCPLMIDHWRYRLQEMWKHERRPVVWGGGSKAVAFLTTLGVGREIEYVVDVNPFKQGTYLPGTGHEIVAPAVLREYRPGVVIVMNPIYREEIRAELDRMDLVADLVTV